MYKKILLFSVLVVSAVNGYTQSWLQLLDNNTINTFIQEISGERAKGYVLEISKYHRIRGGGPDTDYDKAVDYVVSELSKGGIENVKVHQYLSDGTKEYGTWRSPVGFRAKSAKLYLVEPRHELWCDFSETAVSLMAYCNGGSDEAEVVYVGRGLSEDDYVGKNVNGKIVFADRTNATSLMREAVMKRGAVGIITGFSGREDRYQFPDLVELQRLYITGEEMLKTKWGFSLSYRQTENLKRLLNSGRKVVMRAEVDAEVFAGYMPVVSAVIPGTNPEQEVLFMAHLDHYKPGANDNASGSAGLIEIAKVLNKLIKDNKINPPKRNIRFLWVPECNGTAPYIEENYEQIKKGIVGINLDMIGEDYEKCNAFLVITRTPWSMPSFLDGLLEYYANAIDYLNIRTQTGTNNIWNYRVVDYSGGSDHIMFNDPRIGVPSTMIVHRDHFHHSSYDTPDKVDPTEMKRSILLGLFTGWTAANHDESNIKNLIEIVFNSLTKRIETYSIRYLARLKGSDNENIHRLIRDIKAYYDILKETCAAELDATVQHVNGLDSRIINDNKNLIKAYVDIQKTRANNFYRELCRERNIRTRSVQLNSFEKECSQIYPKRLSTMPVSWEFIGSKISRQNIRHAEQLNYEIIQELINFVIDGHNLIYLRNAVSAEFQEISLEMVKDLFEELKKTGIMTY